MTFVAPRLFSVKSAKSVAHNWSFLSYGLRALFVSDRGNNRIMNFGQRIVILRCGCGSLSSLVFIREIREIRSSKTNDDLRSTELALQTSHSDGMVGWCWLRISRISRMKTRETETAELARASSRRFTRMGSASFSVALDCASNEKSHLRSSSTSGHVSWITSRRYVRIGLAKSADLAM